MHGPTLPSYPAGPTYPVGEDLQEAAGESLLAVSDPAGEGRRYSIAEDNAARFVVYFGPYILWGSIGALAGLLFLLSG